jgi:hypothetical protein
MQYYEVAGLFKIKYTLIKFRFLLTQSQNIVQLNVLFQNKINLSHMSLVVCYIGVLLHSVTQLRR